ncbi:MAG: hypothetical protein R3Y46_01620 [Opitutales bacterium]
MEEFTLTTPLNGFPFILQRITGETQIPYYTFTFTQEEAIKIFWKGYLKELNLNINVSISKDGENIFTHNKSYSSANMDSYCFDIYDVILEAQDRVAVSNETAPFYFYHRDDNVFFSMFAPYYVDEDEYEFKFYGSCTNQTDTVLVRVLLGDYGDYDLYENCYKYYFYMTIFDKTLPCVLLVECDDNIYSIDEMTASASIESGYLD